MTFLSKGKTRRALSVCTKRTHTGTYSLTRFSETLTLPPLQTGHGEETFKISKKLNMATYIKHSPTKKYCSPNGIGV